MPVNVVMPQMGESVAEGTVVRWIKRVGDAVDRDEPLFEISTDKVDAEIPSPAAGTLSAIHVKEGETVPVDSIVAVIAQAGEAVADGAGAAPAAGAPAAGKTASAAPTSTSTPEATGQHVARSQPNGATAETDAGEPQADGADEAIPATTSPTATASGGGSLVSASAGAATNGVEKLRSEMTQDELRRHRSSPLVRKIASEHNVDIRQISGSGVSGRVTKHDILNFIEHRPAAGAQVQAQAPAGAGAASAGAARPAGHIPAYGPGERVEIVPLSVMRKKIADHMILSRRTSAHVHSVFEVDFTQVAKIRAAKKAEYERAGVNLTFLGFIAKAVVDALRAAPVLNASLDGDNIVYKKDINLGIAVALDWGLIVPVLKHADEKNLLGISRGIADLATRARAKQLKPEDVQQGTFTITNPGIFGAQFGMPIINQPQVAILGVGTIEKRAVVIDDAIAIRPRGYLTLGYDHRLVDGAVADQFMAQVKDKIEKFDPAGA
jgi:2-oxoglutarate dehydrogenase E2 component (dihydrolipoamide succinyltransferase)